MTRAGSLVYFQKDRTERVIATARVALAFAGFFAVWLDPTEPARHEDIAYGVLLSYAVYAVAVAIFVWQTEVPARLGPLTHVADLIAFALFIYFSHGPNSPFFTFMLFALLAGSLRWQWRGALWTATGAMAFFLAIGIYTANVQHEAFELNRFIIRCVILVVVAVLLGYFGSYERRVRTDIQKLSATPPARDAGLEGLLEALLAWAAETTGSRRALIAWEEPEEPWLNLGLWDQALRYSRERPDAFQPLVAEPFSHAGFLCQVAGEQNPVILVAKAKGSNRWHGDPVNPDLVRRFSIASHLSFPLNSESFGGRLFLLDKPGMTSDDLVLGDLVARHISNRLDHFYLQQQLKQSALLEERMRVARDIHDGALQALAGVALEIETLLREPAKDNKATRARLLELQQSLVAEQRNLRNLVEQLRARDAGTVPLSGSLTEGIEALGRQLARRRSLKVEWSPEGLESIPSKLSSDVYFLLQEALNNAARHAGASVARIGIEPDAESVTITVGDNGHGFPFKGHYDHATLAALHVGPATLKERVASLGGRLSVDSTESGTKITMTLPVEVPVKA